jgi:hypothetical protein
MSATLLRRVFRKNRSGKGNSGFELRKSFSKLAQHPRKWGNYKEKRA